VVVLIISNDASVLIEIDTLSFLGTDTSLGVKEPNGLYLFKFKSVWLNFEILMGFDRMTAPLMHVMRSFAFSKVPLLSRPPISTEKKIRKVTHQRSQGSLKAFLQGRFLVAQTPRTLSRQRHHALPEVAGDPIIGGSRPRAVTSCQQT
jgi:hypothetical protein